MNIMSDKMQTTRSRTVIVELTSSETEEVSGGTDYALQTCAPDNQGGTICMAGDAITGHDDATTASCRSGA
jgi:hypothetical protein